MSIGTGTRLGQYEVQDFIGQGAMGLVYRAYHPDLERTGAVKILQAISPDADTVARFRHEAQAIAQLRHPNIVNVYDFGAFQGTPYMIVEYIPGGSLAERMSHGSLDQPTALKYLRGIASGLDYAHAHGVVHRDVKPANVLLTGEDTPVLADFGLAKLLQGSSLKSMTGVTTGTPAYMAPEQVMGHQVGPAADRYSLATIAYEMLTGVIPFDGEALMELLYAQVHRDPLPPSARVPALTAAVDAVILRGLAKDPAERWGSASALVEELAASLQAAQAAVPPPPIAGAALASTLPLASPHAAPATDPAPATVAMPLPAAAPPAQPSPAARARRLPRRQILLGLAAVLVLLLVLGTCAALAQATTLSVSPTTAARGDVVTVSATHVPAAQTGEIQLWSVERTFPFTADANGNVRVYITMPRDIALGDHTVKICWSGSCHRQAPLRVVAALGEVVPTPVADQSPGPSPTPYAAPAGATPTATSSGGSTPGPTSSAAPASPTPCKTVAFGVPSISLLNGFTAYFSCFPNGSVWAVTLYADEPVTGWTSYYRGSATIAGSSYSKHFSVPVGPLAGEKAYVKACNGTACFSSTQLTIGA